MAKVYVVTSGTYSDYRIVGIFDSKKQAELFQATSFSDEVYYHEEFNYEIEEYELNENKLDGNVFYGIRANFFGNSHSLNVETVRSISPIKPHIVVNHFKEKFYYFPTEREWSYTKRKSKQGKKIVCDKIAELEASEKGVL